MNIAVIPARGGSKRIPRKNIKMFRGKPMIAWTIEVALQSKAFDRILVSTDDEEISQVAKDHGALAPFVRPPELSDDFATTGDVISHAIRWAMAEGWELKSVCCLYATAPFLRAADIRGAQEILEVEGSDFVFSATDFPSPIFRSFGLNEAGNVKMFFPEHFRTRSQDLPAAYHDAAQFYWGRKEAWLENKAIFAEYSKPYIIPRWRVQDIDTQDDWIRAEVLASALLQLDGASRT